jgi:hypothetical protein
MMAHDKLSRVLSSYREIEQMEKIGSSAAMPLTKLSSSFFICRESLVILCMSVSERRVTCKLADESKNIENDPFPSSRTIFRRLDVYSSASELFFEFS